jgi:hypothetical protein
LRTEDTTPKHHPGDVVTIKNVVVPLEIEYLQEAAKKRGISRTKLVRVVMERVVKDELVLEILDDDDQVRNEPRKPKYRRFRERNPDRDRTRLHHPISAQSRFLMDDKLTSMSFIGTFSDMPTNPDDVCS